MRARQKKKNLKKFVKRHSRTITLGMYLDLLSQQPEFDVWVRARRLTEGVEVNLDETL